MMISWIIMPKTTISSHNLGVKEMSLAVCCVVGERTRAVALDNSGNFFGCVALFRKVFWPV